MLALLSAAISFHAGTPPVPTMQLWRRHLLPQRSVPLLCVGDDSTSADVSEANTSRTFDGAAWDSASAPATRIAEIRRRQARSGAAPGLPGSDTDWLAVLQRAATSRPLTLLLVVSFGLLSVGDFIFNVSRLFVCALPDLCAPAVY
jgi:hypothetical protein